jgi:hypothetical protein
MKMCVLPRADPCHPSGVIQTASEVVFGGRIKSLPAGYKTVTSARARAATRVHLGSEETGPFAA